MLKVVIIGSGNVAQHLITVFENSETINLVQAYARNRKSLLHLLPDDRVTDDFSQITAADIYIISVSDDAIAKVSSSLPFNNQLVVHTSGSASLEQLDHKNRRGVFYPLQTFSKNKKVDFQKIPLCLESELTEDYKTLEALALSISQDVYTIDSLQRQALHVAAVFVNNFTNHMYKLGSDICIENNLPFDILKPLIAETADKVQILKPEDAQTGPALRNDITTIEKHLEFLTDNNKKEIYTLLTRSIQNVEKL